MEDSNYRLSVRICIKSPNEIIVLDMGNFYAHENNDVVTMENNWLVREHASELWHDSSSNPPYCSCRPSVELI